MCQWTLFQSVDAAGFCWCHQENDWEIKRKRKKVRFTAEKYAS